MFCTLNVQLLDNWTQHCPAIGQLDTALSDLWTVGHSIVRSLDSWIQHCPTIKQMDTARCTIGQWTQHCPTIGQLDTALSNHWTVGQSIV